MPEVRSTFQLRPGDAMPDFALPDAWGVLHQGSDLSGRRGLLVVFACNHCPYVVHLAGCLGRLAREWRAAGVETVVINPNDLAAYPQDGPEPMKEFSRAHGWDFPYLLDEAQTTALAFGAVCTPDFFLFDARCRLAYAGQFDSSRPKSGHAPDGTDLQAALRRMLAGEAALPGLPASGCSIKWKPDRKPEWWGGGAAG